MKLLQYEGNVLHKLQHSYILFHSGKGEKPPNEQKNKTKKKDEN